MAGEFDLMPSYSEYTGLGDLAQAAPAQANMPMLSVGPPAPADPAQFPQAQIPSVAAAPSGPLTDQQALINEANRLGVSPLDLATVIHFESGFRPNAVNPDGIHTGLIQFGKPEQDNYKVNKSQSFQEQLPAVTQFLQDRGYKSGMGFLDLYSTINAGSPGHYNAVDGDTNVSQKVASMDKNRAAAAAWLAKDPNVGGGMTAGYGNPTGGPSMGSTMQQGGFGLNGIVGMGQAVPGQASAAPSVDALSSQPLTTMGAPSSSMTPGGAMRAAAARQATASPSPYGNLANLLQGAGGTAAKAAAGQQQKAQQGSAMGSPGGAPSPISLQQARAMYDPSRFFQMLQQAGIQTGGQR